MKNIAKTPFIIAALILALAFSVLKYDQNLATARGTVMNNEFLDPLPTSKAEFLKAMDEKTSKLTSIGADIDRQYIQRALSGISDIELYSRFKGMSYRDIVVKDYIRKVDFIEDHNLRGAFVYQSDKDKIDKDLRAEFSYQLDYSESKSERTEVHQDRINPKLFAFAAQEWKIECPQRKTRIGTDYVRIPDEELYKSASLNDLGLKESQSTKTDSEPESCTVSALVLNDMFPDGNFKWMDKWLYANPDQVTAIDHLFPRKKQFSIIDWLNNH